METFIIMPLIGALIGWLTNYIAIKSLFRPRTPRKILFMRLHGLLPKRQAELAISIGRIIEQELVTTDALSQRLRAEAVKERIVDEITYQFGLVIEDKVPRMLQQLSYDLLIPAIRREIKQNLDGWLERAEVLIKDEARVGEMVTERISGFDLTRLERLVLEIAGKELRHIELLGGVLGGLIGLIQAVIVYFI